MKLVSLGLLLIVASAGACSTKKADCSSVDSVASSAPDAGLDVSSDKDASAKSKALDELSRKVKTVADKLASMKVTDAHVAKAQADYVAKLKELEKRAEALKKVLDATAVETAGLAKLATAQAGVEEARDKVGLAASTDELETIAHVLMSAADDDPVVDANNAADALEKMKFASDGLRVAVMVYARSFRTRAKALRETSGMQDRLKRLGQEFPVARSGFEQARDAAANAKNALDAVCSPAK